MNPGTLADALIARGLEAGEHEAKQALFTGVLETWRMTRGDTPRHVWWVPGRLEVFGKHTDYAGGRALVAAAPRGFAAAAGPRPDSTIRVIDARRGETLELSPVAARHSAADGQPHPARLPGWRHYVDVTARRLAKNFPGRSFGADIVIASDLPPASGMSSSSALVITIAEALGRIGEIHKTPEWRLNVRGPLDAAGYYACIENGRSFGSLDGDVGVGTHGGSEDHSAIVNGRSGHVLGFAFVPSRALGGAAVPDAWRFVIGTCGVKANKTGRAQAAYNKLSADAAALLARWNDRGAAGPAAVSLAAALETPGGADLLRQIAGDLRNRLDHFIREDGRILPAMEAFRRGDAAEIGRLSDESQA
ncbi:MAG TPA: galactokinase family protein, partial [Vicinamibacterales bacterium]|nr:galactokinase family protein [Vicinamibacterales bacterium]